MSIVKLTNREKDIDFNSKSKRWTRNEIFSDTLIVLVFSLFLAFLKPFGMNSIGYGYALVFWLSICFSGYAIYSPIIFLGEMLWRQSFPQYLNRYWLRLALSTSLASLVMSLVAPLVISLFFEFDKSYVDGVFASILPSFFIGGMITLFGAVKGLVRQQTEIIEQQKQEIEVSQEQDVLLIDKEFDEFMTKLPLEKRGRLLCLQMDDHYLNVHTENGHHMLLMRFKDAISHLKNYPGIQTHRSWWVAQDAITSFKKEGRKTFLVLENEHQVPVSNTYLAQVKGMIS